MSQQALDLRRSVQIVRRHRRLFGIVVALGLLAGAAYAVVKPPMLASTALVVLPQAPTQITQAGSGTGSSSTGDSYMATQVVIADSDAVLSSALPHVSPAMSLQSLRSKIQVKNPTGSILAITASGGTAPEAEATANAVANSYVSYVGNVNSPVGHVPARVLEPATNATGSTLVERVLIFGLLGALAGALVGFIVSLAIGRNDRRLRERDEIANSIGVPVLASVPVGHPSDAAGWTQLLDHYEPGVVHAWQLRKTLQQFGVGDFAPRNGAGGGGTSLTVLSFSSDQGALALGPQLASFAAYLGIPTALVIGPQQDANAAATLRAACAVPPYASPGRMRPLQLIASDDGRYGGPLDVPFAVVVTVVDARTPQMPDTMRTAVTMLGVSAGAASAEQLARAATVAATDGRNIAGILVADPDPADHTTGRIPQLPRPAQRRLPTRLMGISTEIRR